MHETIKSLSTAISEKWTMSFWLRGPQREPQTKPLKVYYRSYFTGVLPPSPWLKITHDMTKKEKKRHVEEVMKLTPLHVLRKNMLGPTTVHRTTQRPAEGQEQEGQQVRQESPWKQTDPQLSEDFRAAETVPATDAAWPWLEYISELVFEYLMRCLGIKMKC